MQFKTHEYYNCEIVLSNSKHFRVDGNWLHNEKLDNWSGWECEAGYSRLYINSDNEVYGGQCLNDKLGNLSTKWDLLKVPTECKKQRCTGCTDDLIVAKREVNNEHRD